MDTQTSEQPPIHTPPTPPHPIEQHTNTQKKTFPLIGKIIFFLIIAGLLLFGGYYFGRQTKVTPQASTPTPVLIATTSVTEAISPTIAASPSGAKTTGKIITAGLSGSTVFTVYTVEVPDGWTDDHQHDATNGMDKLTLTKSGYSLTIHQAAFGGDQCIYKGDAPVDMSQSFANFVGITGKSAEFRRGWNDDAKPTIAYTICQKNTTDGLYGTITPFGRIDVQSPKPADATILSEIDAMIASLTKK